MGQIQINPEIEDGAWAEPLSQGFEHGLVERVGNLPNGMASGEPATQILVRLDDGRAVLAEVSWRMFYLTARALEARWGVPS